MMKWFNLADVHSAKHMKDAYSSYRGRIARSHAEHVRHVTLRKPSSGRPELLTVITSVGLESLFAPTEAIPRFRACKLPMRLKDGARDYIVRPGVFTTRGLEPVARELASKEFVDFLTDIGAYELIEPDFMPL